MENTNYSGENKSGASRSYLSYNEWINKREENKKAEQQRANSYNIRFTDLLSTYEKNRLTSDDSLVIRDNASKLLADLEKDQDLYKQIYGDYTYNDIYKRTKDIYDISAFALGQNKTPEFDAEEFKKSLGNPTKHENDNSLLKKEDWMPSISKDGSTAEQNKDIESRNELLNAQGKFNKDVSAKKEESKTVFSLPEKDKPENDKEVKSDSAPGWMSPLASKIASDENANIPEMPKPEISKKDEAGKKPSVGKKVAGGAETAYMNVALGAADAVSSIANSLEQALGDAASGGAYSDGFKVLGEYFSAMPQEMRSDVLLNLSAEGMPKRGAYLADVSKKTGVPSNVILQYAKSAQNETMREEVANSGYSQYVNPNTREKIANVSFSIGQQIPGLMLSGSLSGASAVSSGIAKSIGANPSTVLIGMSAAGNKTFELAREKGYNPSLYAEALVQGGIEMILEGAIGFSDLPSYAKRFANTGSSVGNVAKAFVRYIIGGAEEGIEEVLNVPLSNLASRAFGSDKKFGFGEGEIFDWKAMVESGLNGLTVGLIMGGVTGTALAVSGAKEGTDIRANAEWLNNMAQKLPEHYRPADTIDAATATAKDVEAYGKELTNAFKEYMTDSMNGNAVVNNKDLYGEDVASVTEDNAIVQLGDQAEVLAHVQADDTEGAKEIIDQKIQHYTEMAAAVGNDSSLQELGGEGTSEKIASNIAHLNETKGMIENGNYNADAAQKAIAAGLKEKIAEGKKTTAAANKFAESVKNSLGVARGERAIAHTIELLEGDVKNGVKGASQQLKVARKALASIQNAPSSAVRSLLGASEKTLGKAISDDSKKRSVQLDYSMPENSYASYNRNTGEVKVNPIAILRAQNQMDNGNKARSEFVHEAGHIAAQMDASFVSKVYDVYAQLRDSGIIPQFGEDGINENEIREAYKKDRSLTNYLNTATVKAGVKQLMEQGATLEQAQSGFVDAFLKEEVAMHFLSYAENHGAKLFDTIVPEKRNAFVQAMRKIAQFFRDIAAKIRKQDPASAKKMDSLADKLYSAVAGYAGGSTTAQERTNAKTTENTGNTKNEATKGSTGTHTEDERKSIATGNYARSEYEDVVEDVRYSILDSFEQTVKKIDAGEISQEEMPLVKVSSTTPDIIVDKVNAPNLPILIRYDALYLAMKHEGNIKGHYHNLGPDAIVQILKKIADPDEIISIGGDRINVIVPVLDKKNRRTLVSVEFNAPKEFEGGNNYYNIVISMFGTNEGYISKLGAKEGSKVVYKKSDDYSQVNHGLNKLSATFNESSSVNTSISHSRDVVNTSDKDSRSSLVLDSDYMSAVKRGDTETAQMMVDEAAKAAGYNYHLYHGTDADFTKFDLRKFGGRNGKGEGYGIYLAANREISAPYGKNVINSYTKFNRLAEGRKRTLTKAEVKKIIQKSCEIEARRMVDDGEYDSIAEAIKDTWVSNYVYTYDYPNMSRVYTDVADIVFGGNDNDGEIINEIMSASGGHYNYDGALDFYENVLTPTTGIDGFHYIWGNADGSGVQNDIYLAFSSEQIKSADPITYDDNGNVIPLSERFKESNDDIRYSKVEDLEKKIARLKEDKEFLRRQMQRGRSVALLPKDADRIVKEMHETYGADRSDDSVIRKMLEEIEELVNGKIKSEHMEETFGKFERDARAILENVYEVDVNIMRENEAFIKYIRSTPLSVPSDNENDLPGGYGDYRNENRKYVNLSRNGTPIDSVYNEICEQFPGMLDRTIANPADMVEEIVHVMKSLEPEDVPVYSDTIDQASNEFVNALIAKYMNTAQKTYAQKLRDKADEIRKDNADRRVAAEVNRVQSEADRMEKSYQRYIESINKKNERRHQQTVTAYEARLNSIENAAARDAQEYERIINRYKDIEAAREFAGDRKEYARRIRQDARAIRSAAVSPNQKKFIPEGYRKNVENIALWLDRVSVGGVNLNSDDAKWTAIAYIRDDINKVSAMFGEDFLGLANGLLNQIEDITGEAGRAYNKDLKAAIFYRDAYKLGRLMRKSIADMNKVYLLEKRVAASMVANEITETLNHRRLAHKEFESLADKGQTGKFSTNFKKVVNFAYNRNLSFTDARTFFHRMGKAGDGIYETLRSAQSRQYLYIKQYTDKVGDALDDVDLSRYAGSKQKMVNITLSHGKEFTLTAAQAMNIVTLYERAAGKSHIENGGVRIYNPATKQASKATALTEKDIVSLRNALDETDKKVMRVLSDFMRNECTAWGNEATMEKYGFHRFTTKDYFPISVDRTATGADMKSYAPAQFNVENVGFAKPTKDNASAPVMIDSMIDVANNHIRGMASYAAYLNVEDGINRIMKVPGVVDTMKRALGSEAEKYITEMMNDLKGAGKTEALANNTVDYLNKFAGRYKAAAVSYNASTVAKQPLSYLRAAAVLNEKYLIKGAVGNRKQAFEEMMKYSGIAVRKEIGYSDVGVGKTIGEQIGYTEKGTLKSGVRKFNEFGMAGAALADRVTWESIWLACKAEQLEKNASAAIDNDALMKATAKRFEEVIAQTQVVDSALDSAPVSRSDNPLVRLTYAFMSEPIKGYNLFGSALDDFFNSANKADKKRAGKHLAKVVAYTLIGWAAEAAITSAFSAIRDDDDEFVDKFSETYFGNLGQNALGILPMADPIVDAFLEVFKGYTPSNMADQTIVDVASTMVDTYKIIKDPEGKRETKWKAARDAVESVFTMIGVPVKNIVRIVNNSVKSAFHITNAYKASYELQKFWYNPNNATARDKNGFNSILADAYLSGDKEAFEYIYEDMRKMGLKPQQLVNSIAKDAYADDIADSEKSTLVKYTPGSEPWYIGMKTIFGRDEDAPKATEDEITRVYKATGETSVLPKFKSGEYTVDKEDREFTGDSLDKYLDDYGKLYYEVANAMRDLAAYRKGTVEEQAWWLTKAEKYASAVAVYMQDDSYSVTTVGKWVVDYIDARPVYVAKYIVGNLKPKKE